MKKLLWCLSLILPLILFASAAIAVPVTDGLIIHLQWNDLRHIALYDGEQIALWPDATGAEDGIDGSVKTAAGATLPTFNRDGYKGLPSVHFDDTLQQALQSDQWTWDQTQGVTIFILCTGGDTGVHSIRAAHVGDYTGATGKTVGCDICSLNTRVTDSGSGVRYNNGWCLTATVSANPVQPNVWHSSVRRLAQGGTYASLYYAVNATPNVTVESNRGSTYTMDFNASGNILSIGNGPQNSGWPTDWYHGDIAEILVFNKQLTATQMEQVLTYLNNNYKLAAHNPSPADASISQGTLVGSQAQVSFTWNTALQDDLTTVNPNVTAHYFYLGTDPNFVGETPTATLPVGTCTSGPYLLSLDQTYYWCVNESVLASGPNDPNTIWGPIWSFETKKSVPVINEQPQDASAFPGGTATIDIAVSSIAPVTYYWYKSGDDATNTPGDDNIVGGNSNSYTITPAQLSHEGYYFCKVTNGGESNTVTSTIARFGLKREVAHWTLNLADYDATPGSERYIDVVGAHNVDPNDPPIAGSIVTNNELSGLGEMLNLTVLPKAAGKTDPWIPTFGTSEFTVSAWVKWSGVYGLWPWQGLVCSRSVAQDAAGADTRNWLLEITNTGILHGTLNMTEVVKTPGVFATGEWKHVVYTATNSMAVLYIDGVAINSVNPSTLTAKPTVQQLNVPTYFGAIGRSATTIQSIFNGLMDEVRVYNYAMSNAEVIDELYYDVSGTPACVNLDAVDLSFDVAGPAGSQPDCVVNLADFAALAAEWLNCGYYPTSRCP